MKKAALSGQCSILPRAAKIRILFKDTLITPLPNLSENTMKTFPRQPSRGFTLVEMMIVVVILAILVAFAFPNFMKYIRNTRLDNARTTVMLTAQNMQRFYNQNMCFPVPTADPSSGGTPRVAGPQCYLGTSKTNTIIPSNNQFFNFAAETPNVCDPSASAAYTAESFCVTARPNANNPSETRFLKMNQTGTMQVCDPGNHNDAATAATAGTNCSTL